MRWSDLDSYRHVNNVAYLRYLEEARIDLIWDPRGTLGASTLRDGVVVARHEIDYRRPLDYRPAGVQVEVWVESISTGNFVLAYEIRDQGTVFARAKTVMVPFDLATQRPRRVGDEERAFLERFLDASAG